MLPRYAHTHFTGSAKDDPEMRDRASVSLCVKWEVWPCASSNFLSLCVPSWHISLFAQTHTKHFMHQERQLHNAHNHTERCHTGWAELWEGGRGEDSEGPSARLWVTNASTQALGPWKTLEWTAEHMAMYLQAVERKDPWQLMSSCWARSWSGKATPPKGDCLK